MNEPSLEFCAQLKEGGTLLINADTVSETAEVPSGAKVYRVPFTGIATERLGRAQLANIVSIGALMRATGIFEKEFALQSLLKYFENKGKGKFNASNEKAYYFGYDAIV
jgi:2-oxoglutarate ferredoxin oxidoreductase subunit gamma